jgi:hypothetical protein
MNLKVRILSAVLLKHGTTVYLECVDGRYQ